MKSTTAFSFCFGTLVAVAAGSGCSAAPPPDAPELPIPCGTAASLSEEGASCVPAGPNDGQPNDGQPNDGRSADGASRAADEVRNPWNASRTATSRDVTSAPIAGGLRFTAFATGLTAEVPAHGSLEGETFRVPYSSNFRSSCVYAPAIVIEAPIREAAAWAVGALKWRGMMDERGGDPLLFNLVARVERNGQDGASVGKSVRVSDLTKPRLLFRGENGDMVYAAEQTLDVPDEALGLPIVAAAGDRVSVGVCDFGAGVELRLTSLVLETTSAAFGPP